MNKAEFIKTFAQAKNLKTEDVGDIVDSFFDCLKATMLDGDRVEIRGFGTFQIRDYKGFTGRNPKSGENVEVAPKKLPYFRPGKEFREYINKT